MTCCGRGTPPTFILPTFSEKFQANHFESDVSTRYRKFDPKNFFFTMIKLVMGKNSEGYSHALTEVFGVAQAPAKSSLSKLRKKVRLQFFKDIFTDLVKTFRRPTWHGLYVYAVDGFEMALPRTKSILKADYQGRRVKHKGETYYPHMYMVHAFDVLSRTTKSFVTSHFLDELKGAKELVKGFEQNSICLYDRLYISSAMIEAHLNRNSYFLMRVRSSGILKDIANFIKSRKTRGKILFESEWIYLFKIKNPKTKEYDVFATNYSRLGKKSIRELYNLRWEVENSFRDLNETLKAEQWHSKSIKGVMQELYTRANFKLILSWVTRRLFALFKQIRGLMKELKLLIQKSSEKRKRHSRSYPRQIRYAISNYTHAGVINDWDISS